MGEPRLRARQSSALLAPFRGRPLLAMCLASCPDDGGDWVTVLPRRAKAAQPQDHQQGSDRAPLRALNAAPRAAPPGAVAQPGQQPAASRVTSSALSAAARSAAVAFVGARADAAVAPAAFQPARQGDAQAAELLGLACRFPHLFPLLPAADGQGPSRAAHAVVQAPSLGGPGAPAARDVRCVACTPRGRCAKHRRAAAVSLAPRRVPTLAAGATVLRADRDASASAFAAPALGAEERAAVVAAAAQLSTRRSARKASSGESSADSASDAASSDAGDDDGAAALELHTDWAAQRRNVRVRERAMRLAGWGPRPGAVGEHPQWRRALPGGLVQCIAVPGSPSDCRHWDNQSAMLRRLDRAARGEA